MTTEPHLSSVEGVRESMSVVEGLPAVVNPQQPSRALHKPHSPSPQTIHKQTSIRLHKCPFWSQDGLFMGGTGPSSLTIF